jgi:hypothetical protein
MVRKEQSHPSWWQLYLLGLGMIGLLVLGALLPLSERGHQAVAIGSLLLFWGLVELWLRANMAALLRVSELLLTRQPRPRAIERAPEDERQSAPVSWRQPPEVDGQWATGGVLALQERDGRSQ